MISREHNLTPWSSLRTLPNSPKFLFLFPCYLWKTRSNRLDQIVTNPQGEELGNLTCEKEQICKGILNLNQKGGEFSFQVSPFTTERHNSVSKTNKSKCLINYIPLNKLLFKLSPYYLRTTT